MKTSISIKILLAGSLAIGTQYVAAQTQRITPVSLKNVTINDSFWSPRLHTLHTVTVYDVLDKLEGKYQPDREDLINEKAKTGRTRNAFLNFDRVTAGKVNTGESDGPPWYDGLVYETISGASDLLIAQPDSKLEHKLDAYINRIAAAQAADPDGYIDTYTTLNRPTQRWGTNGGDDRWQHDLYNAGMLVEAGVHYYKATGKTHLLQVGVKMANYMCKVMGDAPKLNIIPGHAGPEEAFFSLYVLLKNNPALANSLNVPAKPDEYLHLAKYWIEHRGMPTDADGSRPRQAYGSYNQDDKPVFDQQSIEGHAVRATLLGTAIATIGAYENNDQYIQTANRYWNNMAGKRTFITGGQGAIADDEKFGPDYFLPQSAYLETCASIGSAFFSERMNEMQADGKYMDEFERSLYNNILSGISLDGNHYNYENPLIATNHPRWVWHGCPCCPPMILKMTGALPGFIYGTDRLNGVYVNLFIGSTARIGKGATGVTITQHTGYPWNGQVQLNVSPAKAAKFAVRVRIPGWAEGKENPFDLYNSRSTGKVKLAVNGKDFPVHIINGYAVIDRKWQKNDKITLVIPVEPRIVTPDNQVKTLDNKLALAAGPLVYAFEKDDNSNLQMSMPATTVAFKPVHKPNMLDGINIIQVTAPTGNQPLIAVPFYSVGNRGKSAYQVWMDKSK